MGKNREIYSGFVLFVDSGLASEEQDILIFFYPDFNPIFVYINLGTVFCPTTNQL